MHILVVEDERRLAALMSCRLLEERHTADVIRDGITGLGLALATNAGYDLIVLDRMLPGLDGLELCRGIRAAGIAVPVLMVSFLHSEGEYWARLAAAAVVACLPVILAGWLAQKQLVRGLSLGALK